MPLGQPTVSLVARVGIEPTGSMTRAYEARPLPLRSIAQQPWWRTSVARRPRAACKAALRSCGFPSNGAVGRSCICTRLRARVSETRVSAVSPRRRDHEMGGVIARYRSGTSAFTARDAGHYTTITIVDWSGRLVTIQRPPVSKTGTLPAELRPDELVAAPGVSPGPVGYRPTALILSYTAMRTLQPSQGRRRTAALQTWPSPAKPGCAVRGDFIPGGRLAPRSGLEPL